MQPVQFRGSLAIEKFRKHFLGNLMKFNQNTEFLLHRNFRESSMRNKSMVNLLHNYNL